LSAANARARNTLRIPKKQFGQEDNMSFVNRTLATVLALTLGGLVVTSYAQAAGTPAADTPPAHKKVLISQVVEHPALDDTTKGIIDTLTKSGFKSGENLDLRVESAQANPALAAQIASKFANQKPDVVVGVGTISAQSFAKYANDGKVKLIFSSITDPLGASLVQSLEKPGKNTSGVSNFVALEPQIKLFLRLQPQLKRLGVIYNPGEINSVSIVKKLEVLCPQMGLTLVKQVANRTAEVAQAATHLAANADAIFISNDNTSLSALQSVVRAANQAKIPVYVSDTDAVILGALAALGPNQYDVGVQTGKMVVRTLNGENPGTMPVEFPLKTDLYINLDAAKMLNITIPDDLRAQAAALIEKQPKKASYVFK
jgi:putative ABC transport system substrate-binding protein